MTKEELRQKLQEGIDKKPVDFTAVFQAAYEALGWETAEAASLLMTSRPTIQRWNEGKTSPHPIAWPSVFSTMLRCLELKDFGDW